MSSKKRSASTIDDRSTLFGDGDGGGNMMGSYDVAEFIVMSRPRYHIAPGPFTPVPSGENETVKMRREFVASLPYQYPATSSSGGESQRDDF